MQTHPKKRVEIIIEAPLVKRILERLDQTDITGYSVVPVIAGRGRGGSWSSHGQVSDAGQMMAIICIADEAKLDRILDTIFAIVSRQIGLVTVTDVEVMRSDRF